MSRSFTPVSQLFLLIKKEWQIEWRNRYALNGLLLYLISTIFICYLSFNVKANQLNPPTWNALFWIIMVFSAVNAVAKSFMQEQSGRLF
jgi:heme exporter protein B